jgi:small multidrug resistance pump
MQNWIILFIAIICEVFATSMLKQANGFTSLWPSIAVIVGYVIAIFLLSLTLKTIPVGIAYAIWCGVGISMIAVIGWVFLGQVLDRAAILGMTLIVIGITIINLFSKYGSPS